MTTPSDAVDFLKALRDLCERYRATLVGMGDKWEVAGVAAGVPFRRLCVNGEGLTCELETASGTTEVRFDFSWVDSEK